MLSEGRTAVGHPGDDTTRRSRYTEGVTERSFQPPANAGAPDLAVLRPQVLAWLAAHLTPLRYQHSLNVGAMARGLAERFGGDPDRLELAGLLHDVAREWSGARLLAAAGEGGLPVDYLEEMAPMPCLHGPVGAGLARETFGVTDEGLLSAIAHHTMGRERMTLDEQILFIADAIEPGRGDAPYLADIRAAAQTDLDRACRRAYDHTFEFLLRTGQPIHPDAARGRNWLIYCERRAARAAGAGG